MDVAADASILNTGTAGSVNAIATRNVSFRNDGTATGAISLTTVGIASTTSISSESTPVVPTSGDPVRRTTEISTRTVASRATGGNIAVFANFSSATGATNTNSTSTTTTVTVLGSTTGSRTTTLAGNSNSTVIGGASTVTVTGQVRNVGSGTGSVASTAATGVASALVNGGRVERDLAVTAGAGINLASAFDRSELVRGTVFFGSFLPAVVKSSSERQVTVSSLARGSASAMLTNAVVFGQVNVSGVGTSAGVLAASASIDAASTAGALRVTAANECRSSSTATFQQGCRLTGNTATTTDTARGGLAALAITSGAGVPNAVGGAIVVDGFSCSVLTIGAGARVLTNNGGAIRVGGTSGNGRFTLTSRFDPANGVLIGQTTVHGFTPVTGPASIITSAGIIGASTEFFAAPVTVRAVSVGGATISNAGQIFGDAIAAALGERREVTTVTTFASQTAPETTVKTSLFAPLGAAARTNQGGLISERAEAAASTGAVINNGVICGAVQLG